MDRSEHIGRPSLENVPSGPQLVRKRPKGRRVKTWAHDSATCRENRSQDITDNTTNVEQGHHVHYNTSQPDRYNRRFRHTHYLHRPPSTPTILLPQGRR